MANPTGINQYTSGGMGPRDSARKASDDANKFSAAIAKTGNDHPAAHSQAAGLHDQAARAHSDAAAAARAAGDIAAAHAHEGKADSHRLDAAISRSKAAMGRDERGGYGRDADRLTARLTKGGTAAEHNEASVMHGVAAQAANAHGRTDQAAYHRDRQMAHAAIAAYGGGKINTDRDYSVHTPGSHESDRQNKR